MYYVSQWLYSGSIVTNYAELIKILILPIINIILSMWESCFEIK
jgi:hypothetical protein